MREDNNELKGQIKEGNSLDIKKAYTPVSTAGCWQV